MDREKVIKGLECCTFILGKRKCNECPYQKGLPDNGCYQLQDDFHALLKEQETTIKAQQFVLNNACEKLKEQKIAMKPKNIDKVGGNCPVCGLRMARSDKYCSQCGQEMDWE